MKTFSNKQGIIKIDGETYYHFSHGGKQTSTKFIKVDDETYYNSNKPYEFESQSSNQIFMIEAIGWLIVAVVVMYLGKVIGKRIWPEDWEDFDDWKKDGR